MYLLYALLPFKGRLVIAHLNHGARGRASDKDMEFVGNLGRQLGLEVRVGRLRPLSPGAKDVPGFERRARDARRDFLFRTRDDCGASRVLLGHTADDQVETVLMRIFEGAGISGLKGIPRRTAEGIERPLLDTWREQILDHLARRRIPFRTDATNFDTRFERNWVRRVLIPLLESRYGKGLRKRIFALGERFREIDEFLGAAAGRWMRRNVRPGPAGAAGELRLPRASYSKLPSAVRKKIVQLLCFDGMNVAPNERLIEAVDAVLVGGKPSARLSLGKDASLCCRYGEAFFRSRRTADGPAGRAAGIGTLAVREMDGKPTPARLRRLAAGEKGAAFDADRVSGPFSVRPLRAGDRIRPYGHGTEKKVKEILIDRKVPREERWGRAVVCDASGEIVWIPGVVRSSIAPVSAETRRTAVVALRAQAATRKGVPGSRVC